MKRLPFHVFSWDFSPPFLGAVFTVFLDVSPIFLPKSRLESCRGALRLISTQFRPNPTTGDRKHDKKPPLAKKHSPSHIFLTFSIKQFPVQGLFLPGVYPDLAADFQVTEGVREAY